MILTLLGAIPTRRQSTRSLHRRLKLAKRQLYKVAKLKARKARTYIRAAIRSQYYMHYAFADMRRSINRNEDIFITSAIIIAIVAYAATFTAVEFLLLFLNTAYGIAQVTGLDINLIILTAAMTLITLYGWVLSFAVNNMSISIMDGANRKKNRSVRKTLRRGLQQASRVTAAWFTLGALIFLPLLIATGIGYLYIHVSHVSEEELLNIISKAIILAITWVCIVLMQFSLAPQVALFESHLNLKQVFVRARSLVIGKGRIFMLLGYCLVGLVFAASYKLSELLEDILMLNKWVALSFFTIGLAMLSNGILVTLYHKRRLARK
jgi:hypothetical protein